MRRTVAVGVVAQILLGAGVLTAQEARAPGLTATPLAQGLFLIADPGSNSIACVGAHGVVLVDTGYGEMADRLRAAVADVNPAPVRVVVNTHWHFDHVGGNPVFAGAGAIVVAHENVRRNMSSDQRLAVLDRDVSASPAVALPAITYSETLDLHWDDETLSLLHLPAAHSDGDTVVLFRSADVIHTGDIFFNCGYPYIDVTHGGTIDGMIAAVERILQLAGESTRIVPGHGPLATRGDLETYLGMLEEFRDAIVREVAKGEDLSAILEAAPTAELDAKWGSVYFSPAQFTEMVYRSLPK